MDNNYETIIISKAVTTNSFTAQIDLLSQRKYCRLKYVSSTDNTSAYSLSSTKFGEPFIVLNKLTSIAVDIPFNQSIYTSGNYSFYLNDIVPTGTGTYTGTITLIFEFR